MITPSVVRDNVKAEPFRPFRFHMPSGKTYDIHHPEMIEILKNHALIFSPTGGTEFPEEFQSISLMLAESISQLEAKMTQ